MFNVLYSFLAMEATQSTADRVFASLKSMTANSASTSAALTVACFIVAFKLIKLGYDVMSDEQQGGFGGVRLWQILRPIVIVLIINMSGPAFRIVDNVVNYIAASAKGSESYAVAAKMTKDVIDTVDNLYGEENIETWEASDANRDQQIHESVTNLEQTAASTFNVNTEPAANFIADVFVANADRRRQRKEAIANMQMEVNAKYTAKMDGLVADLANSAATESDKATAIHSLRKEWREALETKNIEKVLNERQALKSASNEIYAEDTRPDDVFDAKKLRGAFKSGALFNMIAFWLYDVIFFCVTGFASVVMSILAMFFPWILVFSLLDYFKQAIWQYIATYMSLAFYKVIASCVNYCIGNAVAIISIFTIQNLLPNFSSPASQLGCIKGLGTTQALIYIVGFICMTKVGSIVHMIIPGGANTGDIGSAGAGIATGALGKAAGAAHTATSGAVKVATGGTSVQQSASSKKSAAQTQAFQSNVTNALGKITGDGD